MNPVVRLIEIKREYPAPIFVWTQKDGRMDYSWVDPEVLMDCEATWITEGGKAVGRQVEEAEEGQ